MNTPDGNYEMDESQAPLFDPFPEPQTMPSGWDFSGIFPESAPVVDETLED